MRYFIYTILFFLVIAYPGTLILVIPYLIYRFILKPSPKRTEPKNWQEAFQQECGGGAASMYDELSRERAPYMSQAINFGVQELSKMTKLQAIPVAVIRQWATQAVSDSGRDAIDLEEVRRYFHGMTKQDAEYMVASIQNTCRVFWDLQRPRSAGITHYIWKSDACQQHKHLNQLVCPIDEPLPESITKDPSMHGPIYPGEGYHCLCYLAPVINDYELPSPIHLYGNGKIKTISKREFIQKCVPKD